MIPAQCQCYCDIDYGSNATYCTQPSAEQTCRGVVPLDSLPAAWWNWMWNQTNGSVREVRSAITSIVCEINRVLCCGGQIPDAACTDQLYKAICCIRQTIATDSIAGSVKSSSTCGNVSVDATGVMTANGLGNVNSLTTAVKTSVVGAINELKTTYDSSIANINTCTATLDSNKAPNMHASTATTYGVGNASCYGHVKLSDQYNGVLTACAGVAASQKGLADAYAAIMGSGFPVLGNTSGCALGTASAGSSGTAARSDHVHPFTGLAREDTTTDTNYPGIMHANGDVDNYFRTTKSGIIPYVSNAAGCGYVGTAGWPFLQIHAKNFYGTFNGTATRATFATSAAYADHAICGNGTDGAFYVGIGGLLACDGGGLLTAHSNTFTGMTTADWGGGILTLNGVLRTSGNNLYHYRNDTGTRYIIWDTGNFAPGNYLARSGGTMTGVLTTAANVYTEGTGAINMCNSNIYNINGIYTSDNAESGGEGINWMRTNGNWDSLHATNGALYFTPNRATSACGTCQVVITNSNWSSYIGVPAQIGTGSAPVNVACCVYYNSIGNTATQGTAYCVAGCSTLTVCNLTGWQIIVFAKGGNYISGIPNGAKCTIGTFSPSCYANFGYFRLY